MFDNVIPYIPWIICGILLILLILFLVFLIFSPPSILKRKSRRRGSNSLPTQKYANTTNRTFVDDSPQTSQNSDSELNQNLHIMKSNFHVITEELRGIREGLDQIAYILKNQEGSRLNDLNTSNVQNRKVFEQNQDMRFPNETLKENARENNPPFLSEKEKEEIQKFHDEINDNMSPILNEFCELYNGNQQKHLQTRFQQYYRVSVVNAMDRMQKQDEPALFENASNGKYWAFHIQEENRYAVVPIYDMILDHRSYGPGAFGEVFDCPDFEPQNRYRVKVIQPAFFEPDRVKEKWTLLDKGKLALTEI